MNKLLKEKMKLIKLTIVVVALFSSIYAFSYLYKGHFVATSNIMHPRYPPITEQRRPEIEAMSAEMKTDFIYLLADSIEKSEETGKLLREFHDNNFKLLGGMFLLQLILLMVSLSLIRVSR